MEKIIEDYYNNVELKGYNIEDIINLIKNKKIRFPYMKNIILSREKMLENFNNLKSHKGNFVKGVDYEIPLYKKFPYFKNVEFKYQDNYELLVMGKGEYKNMNLISDYYNEKCRMICKRYDKKYSPIGLWENNPGSVIYGCLKQNNSITYKTIRDFFYEYECTSFPSSVLVSIIKKYESNHILDFSAGWGDRLIASLACGVESYCGVDPNPCLHKNYKKIIRDLNYNNTNVTMIQSPFETAEGIPDHPYNLIFTSPPYFILEQYTTNDDNQSISQHKNVDEWFNKFLLFSLIKAWSYLQVGGYMVINIDNIKEYPDFVGRMLEERSKSGIDDHLTVSTYMGVISFVRIYQDKYVSPRPMWIWKKEHLSDKINTPLLIEKITLDNDRIINVIRDDNVIGGTMTRGLAKILGLYNYDVYYYTGLCDSPIIVGLSYLIKLLQKKLKIYVNNNSKLNFINEALSFGHTEIIFRDFSIIELEQYAINECLYMKKRGEHNMFLPFSLNIENASTYLADQLHNTYVDVKNIKNIWLTSEISLLVDAFKISLPNTKIRFVKCYDIDDDTIKDKRCKIYTPKESFNELANMLPPYPSLDKYDAKIWQFIISNAKNGDYVLNRYKM